MTLDEAVVEFEKDFIVERTVGFEVLDISYAYTDPTRTPNGDRYVTLITDGWLPDEELAAEHWLKEAWRYAEGRGNRLFWGEMPVWKPAEFVAIDQAGHLNDKWLRTQLKLFVGRVYCTLFIEPKKED